MQVEENVIIEILENFSFYTNMENPLEVFVAYKDIDGIRRFVRSEDEEFRAFVRDSYRKNANTFLLPSLTEYIKAFEDDAIVRKRETGVKIYRRLFGTLKKHIVYYLGDNQNRVVVIRRDGWKIGTSSKFFFQKHPLDKPQVKPVGGGDLLKLMRPYVNLPYDDYILFVVYLVQCFCRSDHFVAILTGSQGSGKTTLTKCIRELIDPSKLIINTLPNTRSDLVNLLANNFLVCFDNTQRFNEGVSDLLCAAVTGVTDSRRTLYTNSEQTVLWLHNTIVLNGINAIPKRADFAERSLLFELKKFQKSQYKGVSDLEMKFQNDKPHILGAIFDSLSKSIRIRENLDVSELHRMADANIDMIAIAMALGIDQAEFQALLAQNNKKLQMAYAEQNLLVEAVVNFVGSRSKISGPVTQIYQQMYDSIVGEKRFFPKSASALTRKLNEERAAIEAAGFRIAQSRTAQSNILTISKIPQNQQRKS